MATTVSWNGSNFSVPGTGEEDWGGSSKVDGLLISLAANGLSKAGGSFTLTADVDFGGSFGLKSAYFTSRTSNASTAGAVRLANTEGVYWRNAANSADLGLTVDGSNNLLFNGILISSGAALTASRALVSNGSGLVAVSSVTSTELGYVSGVTSAIQTQLDARLALAGGTMTGALTLAAGSVGSPSLVIDGAGLYKIATNQMGFSSNGTSVGNFASTGIWQWGISGTTNTSLCDLFSRGLLISYSRTDTPAYIQVSHTHNSSGAHAICYLFSTGGDSLITFDGNTSVRWSMGQDISVGGNFVISQAGSLGSTNVLEISNSTTAFIIGTGTSAVHRINGKTQTTVGASGAASNTPAAPQLYLELNINGTAYVVPAYLKS